MTAGLIQLHNLETILACSIADHVLPVSEFSIWIDFQPHDVHLGNLEQNLQEEDVSSASSSQQKDSSGTKD